MSAPRSDRFPQSRTPSVRFSRRTASIALGGLAALAIAAGAAASAAANPAPPAPPAPPATSTAGDTQHLVVPLSSADRPVRLEVSVLNGSITVTGYEGREVVVDAEPGDGDAKHGDHRHHGDDADADDHDDDDSATAPSARTAGLHRIPSHGLDLQVEEDDNTVKIEAGPFANWVALHIKVPAHASLELSLVNGGGITVQGVDGEMELKSTNGGITATDVSGSVVAETVNGEVKVALGRVTAGKPLAFTSFNGDIDVTLPASHRADVRLRTQNGEVWSDFDLALRDTQQVHEQQVEGRHRIEVDHEVRGALGGGGPELRLETFNGSIYLRRRG